MTSHDIAIVGAGAAGLAASIFAGTAPAPAGARRPRVLLLDGARRPGAKILVSGGGRCNVTNEVVTPDDFEGGPRTIIRKVLKGFDERDTRLWFASLGVELLAEPGGKLFPASNTARTVLDALMDAVRAAGTETRFGWRVHDVRPARDDGFAITGAPTAGGAPETLAARRVILATGGMALPKSGSDGAGFEWLRAMGHTVVPPVPALAPLVLGAGPDPAGRLAELTGLTLDVRLDLREADGRLVASRAGSAVFTHFGLSGPAPMDISRHLARNRADSPKRTLALTLGHPALPDVAAAERRLMDEARRAPSRMVATAMAGLYPERLARLLGDDLGRLGALTRDARREAAVRLAALPLYVRGDRGFAFAETTAGGVDLREVDARTMESRRVPGLHLCGEALDADGRIGGFNFQWAWSTAFLAGRAAAAAAMRQVSPPAL